MGSGRYFSFALALVVGCLVGAPPVLADAVSDFYQGKTVEYQIGGNAGGAYDLVGRLVARHLGKHIPGNPAVVVKNNGSAASIPMTNFLYNVAPRDGKVMGMPINGMPIEPRLKVVDPEGSNLKADVTKFNWIGSPTAETQVVFIWHAARAKSIDDVKTIETTIAALTPSDDTYNLPHILNRLLGTKFKIIPGYGGVANMNIAVESGEVNAASGGFTNLIAGKPEWLKDKLVKVLVQFRDTRNPALADVPTITELLKSDEDRQMIALFAQRFKMARPIALPPGVPADRVAAMRAAFDATMKDPEFLAEAATLHLEISPTDGATMQAAVQDMDKVPQATIDRLRALLLQR